MSTINSGGARKKTPKTLIPVAHKTSQQVAKASAVSNQIVTEPATAYTNTSSQLQVIKKGGLHVRNLAESAFNHRMILKDAVQKREAEMTAIEKMKLVRNGISKKDLERLKERASLDYDKLAMALSVTRATLINKEKAEKFNSSLSERIVGLAEIYSYGYEVFEDEARFNLWMFKPNRAIDGDLPFNLMDNQFGREEVKSIIGRIEYGVYS
ncbi:MAG: DUF2384 domain-containing protein [Chitinophagaceae bacterium]|nr:DUF2384 domain-containing protein [Chitinophagaceae bacterium]